MSAPRASCLALAILAGLGCAGRETRASRDAFKTAIAKGRPAETQAPGERNKDGSAANPADATAWKSLYSFTVKVADMLSLGTTTATLPTLMKKLCAEPPEDVADDEVAVRCEPEAPLDPLGRTLTLELSKATVGLVATDLTDSDSADLLAQALRQLAGACGQPWTRSPGRAENAHEELHTCPATAGSLLVLGRFPVDLAGGRWQFSLAVLGPG
jgi:hypothetical protein